MAVLISERQACFVINVSNVVMRWSLFNTWITKTASVQFYPYIQMLMNTFWSWQIQNVM